MDGGFLSKVRRKWWRRKESSLSCQADSRWPKFHTFLQPQRRQREICFPLSAEVNHSKNAKGLKWSHNLLIIKPHFEIIRVVTSTKGLNSSRLLHNLHNFTNSLHHILGNMFIHALASYLCMKAEVTRSQWTAQMWRVSFSDSGRSKGCYHYISEKISVFLLYYWSVYFLKCWMIPLTKLKLDSFFVSVFCTETPTGTGHKDLIVWDNRFTV